ncbi:hypothetical protein HOY80DRAFT_1030520 [Tuber brumale]|nr:hypothetical protein HOY80DRAFT_1030520 [Tuber brumale]
MPRIRKQAQHLQAAREQQNKWKKVELGKYITAHGLAKAVGDYVQSQRAAKMIGEVLEMEENSIVNRNKDGIREDDREAGWQGGEGRRARIHAQIARKWLKKMGFTYGEVRKCVYVDGHDLAPRMVEFKEDGSWRIPDTLLLGEKLLVFITHNESTFNADDGKRKTWKEEGKQLLQAKSRGKGIMVSGFLIPRGRLKKEQTSADRVFNILG